MRQVNHRQRWCSPTSICFEQTSNRLDVRDDAPVVVKSRDFWRMVIASKDGKFYHVYHDNQSSFQLFELGRYPDISRHHCLLPRLKILFIPSSPIQSFSIPSLTSIPLAPSNFRS